MTTPVSVVVNTFNRAASLRLTLDSLSGLDYPDFEVVVVDGPSTDDTEDVLADFADRIKVGRCRSRNLAESRNVGIAMAGGDVVAFIDDDAYPDPAWLDALVAGYDHDEVAATGGPVWDYTGARLQARYCLTNRLGEAWGELGGINPTPYFNVPGTRTFVYSLGTNLSFRRDRLVEIGGFDEEFDYYFDEADVCCRLVDLGFVVKALDDGFVYHKFLPSHVRGPNRAIKNRFSVVKNTVYFALKNGPPIVSLLEICEGLVRFVENQRSNLKWSIAEGLLEEEDLARFERELPDAFNLALQRFAEPRRVRAPEWFATLRSPFRPFPVRRPPERKLHVCFVTATYPDGRDRELGALATGLAGAGHVVRVVTPVDGHPQVDLEDGVWVHRVPVDEQRLPESGAVPAALWRRSASLLEELRRIDAARGVDLVHAHPASEGIALALAGGFTVVAGLPRAGGPPVAAEVERRCLSQARGVWAWDVPAVDEAEQRHGAALDRQRVAVGNVAHLVEDANRFYDALLGRRTA